MNKKYDLTDTEIKKMKKDIPPSLIEMTSFFKIMSEYSRIQILWALLDTELCVNDLASLLNMTKSAISHQLATLKEAKLVKAKKQGKYTLYSLDDNHIYGILKQSLEHIQENKDF